MTDKQPSERALAAAKAVAEEHCQHMETVSHEYQGSTEHLNEATFTEAAAAIIDQHCPAQPAYDGLLATLRDMKAELDVLYRRGRLDDSTSRLRNMAHAAVALAEQGRRMLAVVRRAQQVKHDCRAGFDVLASDSAVQLFAVLDELDGDTTQEKTNDQEESETNTQEEGGEA